MAETNSFTLTPVDHDPFWKDWSESSHIEDRRNQPTNPDNSAWSDAAVDRRNFNYDKSDMDVVSIHMNAGDDSEDDSEGNLALPFKLAPVDHDPFAE